MENGIRFMNEMKNELIMNLCECVVNSVNLLRYESINLKERNKYLFLVYIYIFFFFCLKSLFYFTSAGILYSFFPFSLFILILYAILSSSTTEP